MTFEANGTVSSAGENGIKTTSNTTGTSMILQLEDGSQLSAGLWNSTEMKYYAHVAMGTYLGLGFGSSMYDTDMIIFEASASGVSLSQA